MTRQGTAHQAQQGTAYERPLQRYELPYELVWRGASRTWIRSPGAAGELVAGRGLPDGLRPTLRCAMELLQWAHVFTYFNVHRGASASAVPPLVRLALEELRLDGNHAGDEALLLDGLTKTYPNGTRATRQLCAQIANGQCFGLLGINGAGKTTTFRMLTGEFLPSEGDALLLTEPGDGASKLSVTNQIEAVRRHIGYCPQFDGLQPNMTCACLLYTSPSPRDRG